MSLTAIFRNFWAVAIAAALFFSGVGAAEAARRPKPKKFKPPVYDPKKHKPPVYKKPKPGR